MCWWCKWVLEQNICILIIEGRWYAYDYIVVFSDIQACNLYTYFRLFQLSSLKLIYSLCKV